MTGDQMHKVCIKFWVVAFTQTHSIFWVEDLWFLWISRFHLPFIQVISIAFYESDNVYWDVKQINFKEYVFVFRTQL